jgi:hypothetical protein
MNEKDGREKSSLRKNQEGRFYRWIDDNTYRVTAAGAENRNNRTAQKRETARDAAILSAQYKTLREIRNSVIARSRKRQCLLRYGPCPNVSPHHKRRRGGSIAL